MILFLSQHSQHFVIAYLLLATIWGSVFGVKRVIEENKEFLVKDIFSGEFIFSTILGFGIVPIMLMFKIGRFVEDANFWDRPLFLSKERKTERILFSPKELKRRDSKKKKDDDYWPGY